MSTENHKNSNKIIALILGLISIVLIIAPMPEFLENFKPDWTLLLLIFLTINIPKEFNMGTAFILGILVDVSKGALLGQHAFASLLIVFLTSKLYLQLRNYPLLQLTAIICIMLIIYQFILFWINGVSGISSPIYSYVGPIISGTILWPVISKILGILFSYSTTKETI